MIKRKKTHILQISSSSASHEESRRTEHSGKEGYIRGTDRNDWPEPGSSSFLVEETKAMERARRIIEQQGHRQHARVNAREHAEHEHQSAPEGELQNNIRQNPWLDSQRFDGVDPNLNPEPPLNTEARREFDNNRREQELEKQLRLGNMPKMDTAPKPQGP